MLHYLKKKHLIYGITLELYLKIECKALDIQCSFHK